MVEPALVPRIYFTLGFYELYPGWVELYSTPVTLSCKSGPGHILGARGEAGPADSVSTFTVSVRDWGVTEDTGELVLLALLYGLLFLDNGSHVDRGHANILLVDLSDSFPGDLVDTTNSVKRQTLVHELNNLGVSVRGEGALYSFVSGSVNMSRYLELWVYLYEGSAVHGFSFSWIMPEFDNWVEQDSSIIHT